LGKTKLQLLELTARRAPSAALINRDRHDILP
jgi:hypothetical protein